MNKALWWFAKALSIKEVQLLVDIDSIHINDCESWNQVSTLKYTAIKEKKTKI